VKRFLFFAIYFLLIIGSTSASPKSTENKTQCKNTLLSAKNAEELISTHEKWAQTSERLLNLPQDLRTIDNTINSPRSFCGSIIQYMKLYKKNLFGADLSNTLFFKTELNESNLNNSTLKGASFIATNLKNTNFTNVDLSETRFNDVNVDGLIFEPTKIPKLSNFNSIANLQRITYRNSPRSLIALRTSYLSSGLILEARKVNFAIHHTELINHPTLMSFIKYIFIEKTVGWGLHVWRPITWLLFITAIMSFVYSTAIIRRCDRNHTPGSISIHTLNAKNEIIKTSRLISDSWVSAILNGLKFSAFTSLNINWKDINIGNWTTRLYKNPASYSAVGLIRTLSGIQSLLSLYLFALWLLALFGIIIEM